MSETSELPADLVFLHTLMVENGYLAPKLIGGGRYACIAPLGYTTAIITGRIGDHVSMDDRWCYHSIPAAWVALEAWDGTGEPQGWHRHPYSGRRLAETDHCYNDDDELVPIGTMYTRR